MRLTSITLAALALCAAVTANAQEVSWDRVANDDPGPSTPGQAVVEKEIQAFRQKVADALRACDASRIKQYFAADYTATEGSGWVLNRDDMLQICKHPGTETGIEAAQPAVMRVRALGNSAAVATGTSFLDRQGVRVAVRWLALYARAGDHADWLQVFGQVHRVPVAPPGPPVSPLRGPATPAR